MSLIFYFSVRVPSTLLLFFFFNDTATTEIYTLSLHDALPISTTSGNFTADGTHLVLHPSGTGIQLTGSASSGAVDVQLPQLPLLGAEAHSATFIIFPL